MTRPVSDLSAIEQKIADELGKAEGTMQSLIERQAELLRRLDETANEGIRQCKAHARNLETLIDQFDEVGQFHLMRRAQIAGIVLRTREQVRTMLCERFGFLVGDIDASHIRTMLMGQFGAAIGRGETSAMLNPTDSLADVGAGDVKALKSAIAAHRQRT